MHEKTETLHELCEVLSKELNTVSEKIRRNGGMSAGDLETIDKLTHAIKSIKTTIAMSEDEGYSQRSYRGMNREGRSYRGMGRYSRESYADGMDSILEEMRGMVDQLPQEKRRKAERLIDELST